ncbi:MAG TPA: hypothetical protein VHO71_04995 [Caproiciproducens sp.]|nr:hypothetical protein [Caproiciproducens sp.]
MIKVSDKFYDTARAPARRWRGQVSFGVFDVTAKGDATASADQQPFSEVTKTLDTVTAAPAVGTCEQDQFSVDGSMSLFPDNPPAGINFGWWSKVISGADGTFAEPPMVTYTFSKVHSSVGLTLLFAELVQDVSVIAYSGDTQISAKTFTNLNTTEAKLDFPVENYNKMAIKILRVQPYHYAKLLEISFGIEFIYDDALLTGFDVLEELDLTSNTISSNAATITLNNLDQRFNMFNPENEVRFLQERQQLTVKTGLKIDADYEDIPLGKFYLSKWESPTENTTKFTAYDLLSLMEGTYYKSRMYVQERAEVILLELFNDLHLYDAQGNALFYIHPNIKDIRLSGYLAPMSYRDALQRIAFALSAVVKVDRYGKLLIYRATEETRNAIIIDQYTIYQGSLIAGTFVAGQGVILPRKVVPVPNPVVIDQSMYQTPKTTLGKYYNRVNVEQYSWQLKAEAESLYEGVITGDAVVQFKSFPAAEVTVSGTYESVAIYACSCEVKGASGSITITGKVYEPLVKVVSAQLSTVTAGTTPNAQDVKDVTLIAQDDTAQYVATWLLNQLQNRITQSFPWWTIPSVEVSDFCKVETAFGEYRESQIKKMHFAYNGALTGDSEVIG